MSYTCEYITKMVVFTLYTAAFITNTSMFTHTHTNTHTHKYTQSYDWSNAKAAWAMASPMDCEERLLSQARLTKYANKDTNVFVYRNLVKALPWFTTVREKILDPAYAGWFIRFSGKHDYHVPDCAAENNSKCSVFYHDQEQTPAVPTPSNPHPDGSCPPTGCDVGRDLPCGEYVFDHRNESLREFLINELFLGKTGMGDDSITGFFVDDYWCSDLICQESGNTVAGCPCGDPVQGPTGTSFFFSLSLLSNTQKNIRRDGQEFSKRYGVE